MIIDKDLDAGKVLWFLGGAVLGYVLKEAVEDWVLDQQIKYCPIDGNDEPQASVDNSRH